MNNNICVIGAGYWGKNHLRTLKELGSLGGVVEKDEKTRLILKKSYPSLKIHQSIFEALDVDYDGYTIATPAPSHYEIAKKIIESKKPVLVEKPFTITVEEAKDLVEIAKNNGVNLMVGHLLLFHPAIIKIKNLIEEGSIGRLQYIYSNRINLGKVRTEENVFWSLAPHDIAIFQYLTDSDPKKIKSSGSTFLQEKIPDSTLTYIEYENGVNGHIFVSWLHPFKEHRIVIIGSERMITFEDSVEGKPLKLYSKKIDFTGDIPLKIDGPVELVDYDQDLPLKMEMEYFLEHLDQKKLTKSNGSHGVDVMKVLVEASKQFLT